MLYEVITGVLIVAALLVAREMAGQNRQTVQAPYFEVGSQHILLTGKRRRVTFVGHITDLTEQALLLLGDRGRLLT